MEADSPSVLSRYRERVMRAVTGLPVPFLCVMTDLLKRQEEWELGTIAVRNGCNR